MVMIVPNRIQLAEQVRNQWVATPESGTPAEAVIEGSYWSHAANQFHIHDEIRAIDEDGTYYIELLVTHVSQNNVRVWVKKNESLVKENTVQVEAECPYEVRYRGVAMKHCVVRKEDKKNIKECFLTHDEAALWLAEFMLGKNN